MADISKITVNSTSYSIKDSTARSDISLLNALVTTNTDAIDALKNSPQLPTVSASNNGQVLKVVDGVWATGTDNTAAAGLTATVSGETLVIG